MTKEELAALLNGREIGDEMTGQEARDAKSNGLVVVYGASDDLIEFEGAIRDEAGAYDYDPIRFDKDGPIDSWENLDKDSEEDVERYFQRKKNHKTITPIWSRNGISWQYETDIPHATFDIMEDGEIYCKGIVFAIADILPCMQPGTKYTTADTAAVERQA